MKFKTGDRVKLIRPIKICSRASTDRIGTVMPSKTKGRVRVKFDGVDCSYVYFEKMVEIASQ